MWWRSVKHNSSGC